MAAAAKENNIAARRQRIAGGWHGSDINLSVS